MARRNTLTITTCRKIFKIMRHKTLARSCEHARDNPSDFCQESYTPEHLAWYDKMIAFHKQRFSKQREAFRLNYGVDYADTSFAKYVDEFGDFTLDLWSDEGKEVSQDVLIATVTSKLLMDVWQEMRRRVGGFT